MSSLEQSHNTHFSTQSQASYLLHQLRPDGAPAVSPADDAPHADDVRLQATEKLQVPEVDAAGESHFQTVVVAEIDKSDRASSVMKSKVGFPSLMAVSTMTRSAPAFAAAAGKSRGEMEPTRE